MGEYYTGLTADRIGEIQDRLSNLEGMVDVEKKKEEIQKELQELVDVDDKVKAMPP
jgi:hypothetical protein